MAEFAFNEIQSISPSQPVSFNTVIPCTKGYVIHREGSGIFTLRGIVNCPNNCFARYQVTYNGNIAVPEGQTVGEVSVALTISGEQLQTSRARVTPAAVDNYFNVTSTAFVTVPRGCCFNVSVENASDIPINVQNSNIVISRVA